MTDKEKAKAYDIAVELAAKFREEYLNYKELNVNKGVIEAFNSIFPELQESEDERIRKEIINFLELPHPQFVGKRDHEKWIAWLEKQGDTSVFYVPEISIKDAVEVTSRMQYIEDDMKPIAKFIMDYAYWDLHKDEWNQPTVVVPLFRVLDALIQRGKSYVESVKTIEWQGEQKPLNKIQMGKEYKCIASPRYSTFMIGEIYKPEDEFLCSLMNFCSDCFEPIEDEQKPTDNAEPKFHKGDWVVDNCGYVWKIEGIINQFYLLEGVEGDESRPTIEWADKTFHLWTIQDAKPGDVLVGNYGTFIFMGENDGYCGILSDNSFIRSTGNNEWTECLNPAIKEQRNLLFAKMKEAGYEWDVEKKELKEIEQPKLTEFENAIKDMMDDYRDAIDDNDATVEEVKEKVAYLLSLIPCKPAEWSKKDEKTWKELIEEVKDQLDSVPSPDCRDKEDEKVLKQLTRWLVWLKSIKQRMVL